MPRPTLLRRLTFLFFASLFPALAGASDNPPEVTAARTDIAALLHEFLARVDDPAMHSRFWADDLIYTTGQGVVRSKAQIVESVTAAARASTPETPRTRYGAEDIVVRPYGHFAALTFRLLVHNPDGTTWHSRNSGAFLWRDGRWEVVTWQATREAPPTP